MEHDYYDEIHAFAASLNTSANECWEDALLAGSSRPLTAEGVESIADWLETDAPIEWREEDEPKYDAVAEQLRAIVARAAIAQAEAE